MPNEQEKRVQAARLKILAEMPDVNQGVTVSPSNKFWDTLMGIPRNAAAVTSPFTGNVSYNPDLISSMSQDELENTLTHEFTHTKQAAAEPWYSIAKKMFMPHPNMVPEGAKGPYDNNYYWNPDEMAAFQAERDRSSRLKLNTSDPVYGSMDIPLPKTRKKMGVK
jgi:hypothetical protein